MTSANYYKYLKYKKKYLDLVSQIGGDPCPPILVDPKIIQYPYKETIEQNLEKRNQFSPECNSSRLRPNLDRKKINEYLKNNLEYISTYTDKENKTLFHLYCIKKGTILYHGSPHNYGPSSLDVRTCKDGTGNEITYNEPPYFGLTIDISMFILSEKNIEDLDTNGTGYLYKFEVVEDIFVVVPDALADRHSAYNLDYSTEYDKYIEKIKVGDYCRSENRIKGIKDEGIKDVTNYQANMIGDGTMNYFVVYLKTFLTGDPTYQTGKTRPDGQLLYHWCTVNCTYELILCDYKEHTRFVSAYKVDVLSMVKDFTEQFSNVEISADGKRKFNSWNYKSMKTEQIIDPDTYKKYLTELPS